MVGSADKAPGSEPSPRNGAMADSLSVARAAAPGALISFFLDGPAGRLEALLNAGDRDAPYSAMICHPHPSGGGTMNNKVVYHAAKVFSALGWPVLRFNFRGTGLSEGVHDGRAEVGDVEAGLEWLARAFSKPIVAAGFSFGAAMGLQACCRLHSGQGPTVKGFAALGLPTHAPGRVYSYPFLHSCKLPKLFLSGDRDQYGPEEQLHQVANAASEPKTLVLIPGAEHFFTGRLPEMQAALGNWLNTTFPPNPNLARYIP